MRRAETGFTLLEVMAAVAIIAIVFTTLARVANDGLRSEGVSRRRLEASLLADRRLAQIEIELAAGIAPEIGESEEEEEPYTILVQVTSFDIASAIPVTGFGEADPTEKATLTGVLGDGVSPIRAIEVAVSWIEGMDEMRVVRNTYGIDPVALQGLAAGAENSLPLPGRPPSS
jgi:prepilin-type N-terminal cleavage/methylation domain-containing protein